ncbi:MBL fold metallo-hydrolase [Brevibacillus nitrificans]|uniref:MBL fold metallo-hydrolase n=1 Tax=Brevibacillus nitrificans TaxID=651560 RepID=UPI00285AB9D0|nr:MBL fold metallo-hydrolase [Brevibacillus nitrificans]MDR7317776.1 ribonuclease BN (tRNA processing enzyme) [Brevibacillus nitrificans]
MANLKEAFHDDIEGRKENQKEALDGLTAVGQDIEEGVVYEKNGVQVVAFLVDHPPMEPSYGYRVNFKGHSVVISGDTRYNENLIQHAKGTDLLIHEVAAAKPDNHSPAIQKILSKHTIPEEAAKVFQQVQPKLAVYSHIVLLDGLSDADANLAVRTNKTYGGKLVVGQDLMSFTIGDQVTIKEPHVGLIP